MLIMGISALEITMATYNTVILYQNNLILYNFYSYSIRFADTNVRGTIMTSKDEKTINVNNKAWKIKKWVYNMNICWYIIFK